MPKYDLETIPICENCNTESDTKNCKKCHIEYCKHFASTIDQRYCANCMSDLRLKETIMEKTVEHERSDGTITFSRKYQARHIQMQGTDWLFSAALIPEMTDAEIEATIEYHRANVSLMLQERESRKLERFRKLASITVPRVTRESQEQKEKKEAKKNKKTKIKEIDPNDSSAILAAVMKLVNSGMTQEQIVAMMAGGKKK